MTLRSKTNKRQEATAGVNPAFRGYNNCVLYNSLVGQRATFEPFCGKNLQYFYQLIVFRLRWSELLRRRRGDDDKQKTDQKLFYVYITL